MSMWNPASKIAHSACNRQKWNIFIYYMNGGMTTKSGINLPKVKVGMCYVG